MLPSPSTRSSLAVRVSPVWYPNDVALFVSPTATNSHLVSALLAARLILSGAARVQHCTIQERMHEVIPMRMETTGMFARRRHHAGGGTQRMRRWPALVSLAAASFVDRGEDQTLGILWPQIHQSLGASAGSLGPMLGISKVLNTLMLPMWGYATDRWSRRLLLVCFTGLWGMWTLAIGVVENVPQLLLVRVLSALGLGVFTPAAFSLLADLYPSTRRGRAAGLIHGMVFLGSIIAFGMLPALAARGPEAWRWGLCCWDSRAVVQGCCSSWGCTNRRAAPPSRSCMLWSSATLMDQRSQHGLTCAHWRRSQAGG